jgi:hypothetical protein
MLLSQIARCVNQFEAGKAQAFFLESSRHFAHETALDAVGLKKNQRFLHG